MNYEFYFFFFWNFINNYSYICNLNNLISFLNLWFKNIYDINFNNLISLVN